jgi:hypothetical protein
VDASLATRLSLAVSVALALSTSNGKRTRRCHDPAQAVHGSADVFSAPASPLAWGILRARASHDDRRRPLVADRQSFGAWRLWASIRHATDERRLAPKAYRTVWTFETTRAVRRLSADRARFSHRQSPSASDAPKLVVYLPLHPRHDARVSHGCGHEKYLTAPASVRA